MIQDFLKYIWSLWGIIHWKFNILKWTKDDNLIENIYCYSFFFSQCHNVKTEGIETPEFICLRIRSWELGWNT